MLSREDQLHALPRSVRLASPTPASRAVIAPERQAALTVHRQLHFSPCSARFIGGLAGEEARVVQLHVVDAQCGPLRGQLYPGQLLGWAAILQPAKVCGEGNGSA